MIWIDFVFISFLFVMTLLGISNGPLVQIFRICGLLLAFFLAIFFYDDLREFSPSVYDSLCYFVIFGFIVVVTFLLTDLVIGFINKWEIQTWSKLKGFLGAMLGIVYGIIFSGSLIFGVYSFCSKSICNRLNQSLIAPPIWKGMLNTATFFSDIFLK